MKVSIQQQGYAINPTFETGGNLKLIIIGVIVIAVVIGAVLIFKK